MEHSQRISILLVEDNERTAQLAMEFLAAGLTETENPLPVDVLRCSTMKSSLEALATDHFDAAVVDLNLPDSTGVETIRTLRSHDKDLPMLVLSSSQEPELTSQLISEGADGFVSKWLESPLILVREVLLVLVRRSPASSSLVAAANQRLQDLD